MQESVLLIISLLFAVSMLAMLSERLRISYPIFLVIAGLGISLIPAIPSISLHPDIVFLIFLPPLLYAAAWNTSWKEFWQLRRPIGLLAVGCVIFTATAVAFISHALIPGFSLAMGFLLGGIISPPDAVAATSVLQGLKVPKRIVAILEGESLVNDASSLIVFRFALATILTGQFDLGAASGQFFVVAGMGVLVGLALSFLLYLLHRYFPTTASIDTALTLMTPYLLYIVAEHFHFSGVMSVVTGGLFLSFRSHEIFNYKSRMQSLSVWNTIVFLLNGFVFILIGLQLPEISRGLGQYAMSEAILYGILISLATILIRILWVYPATYLPRIFFKKIRGRESYPPPRNVFLVAWSGMRGVVSLASALAVPLTLSGGEAFPNRNLILFITFVVILVTLVLQGLSLPWIIRILRIEAPDQSKEHTHAVQHRLAGAVLSYLDTTYAKESEENDLFSQLKYRYENIHAMTQQSAVVEPETQASATPEFIRKYRQLLEELVEVRRSELNRLMCDKAFPDEVIRRMEYDLDLEEARLKG